MEQDVSSGSTSAPAAQTPSLAHTDRRTAAEMAFDMFDSATLKEPALLAALQVDRIGYEPDDHLSLRALKAVDQGRMSQAALIKVLGG